MASGQVYFIQFLLLSGNSGITMIADVSVFDSFLFIPFFFSFLSLVLFSSLFSTFSKLLSPDMLLFFLPLF